MDRLQVSLGEEKALAMKRSRISEILVEEGLRWRKQETWFGERVDPDFAKKKPGVRRMVRAGQGRMAGGFEQLSIEMT